MDEDFSVLRRMLENQRYRKNLIDRIKGGTAGPSLVNMLKEHARGTDVEARDEARALLREAGVEWT